MAESLGTHWHPMAAYLYVLHLDGPALAWEYLRRNSEYQRDWLSPRDASAEVLACPWGLRLMEDPTRDAREAQPEWLPDPDGLVHLCPIEGASDGAARFDFWRLPGHKHVTHDGERLFVTCEPVGHLLRVIVPTALGDGVAYAYAVRADQRLGERWRAIGRELALWNALGTSPAALARDRPGRASLGHLHALQALDGVLAGASHREIARVLFGASAVAERWAEDSDLRAQVRRLIQRGQTLMQGGYRRLLQVSPSGKGRSHGASERP